MSSSGPRREPTNAPAAKPASDSAPTIRPWAYPQSAISTVKTTMIQSRVVTRRSQGSTPVDELVRRAPPPPDATRAVPAPVPSLAAGCSRCRRRDDRRGGRRRRRPSAPRAASARRWERRDYGAMYALLDDASRRAYSRRPVPPRLPQRGGDRDRRARRGRRPERRAGGDGGRAGRRSHPGVRPRAGQAEPARGGRAGDLGPAAGLPGLRAGEALSRRSRPARRGDAAVARRQGARRAGRPRQRSSPLEAIAGSIAGTLGAAGDRGGAPRPLRERVPAQLAGRARTGSRRRSSAARRPPRRRAARRRPRDRPRPSRPSPPVRTTIDTRLQEAAVTALAGRFGGIAALDPRNGEIRALAGIAFSAPQPPGSTFKIVTPRRRSRRAVKPPTSSRSRPRRRSTASSWRTPTASTAAGRSATASPTRATRCSRRSA